MDTLITVAFFNAYTDIVVLKSILESRQIAHFFENETLIATDPLASLAYGGIRLKVYTNDIETVRQILDEFNSNLRIV